MLPIPFVSLDVIEEAAHGDQPRATCTTVLSEADGLNRRFKANAIRKLLVRDAFGEIEGVRRIGVSGALEVAFEEAEALGGLLVGACQGLAVV